MASLYRRGDTWWVTYVAEGRRVRRSTNTDDRKLAEKILARLEHRLVEDAEELVPRDASIDDFVRDYLAWAKTNHAPDTFIQDRLKLPGFFRWLGKKKLTELTREDLERYKTHRLESVKARTVNNELRVIRAALNKAVAWGKLHKSPFVGVKLLKFPTNPPRFLSDEEVERLLAAAEDTRLYQVIATAIFAGLRKRELGWLEWEDVDFAQGIVLVRNKTKGGASFTLKNYEARSVPLHGRLRAVLEEARRGRTSGFCFAPQTKPVPGRRYRYDFRAAFERVVARAGLSGVTPHTLRHTFASRLVMAGVSIYKVSRWLGHKDLKTTLIYAHLAPRDQDIDRVA